jgi:hypothetical protein
MGPADKLAASMALAINPPFTMRIVSTASGLRRIPFGVNYLLVFRPELADGR